MEDLKAKLQEIKEDVVTTKQHDFFTEMPYENFEWLIGYAEESLKIESELRDKVEKQQQEIENLKKPNPTYVLIYKNEITLVTSDPHEIAEHWHNSYRDKLQVWQDGKLVEERV